MDPLKEETQYYERFKDMLGEAGFKNKLLRVFFGRALRSAQDQSNHTRAEMNTADIVVFNRFVYHILFSMCFFLCIGMEPGDLFVSSLDSHG